jgi:hypothetical protein
MTGDDDTITLRDAAKHFGFSVYILRTEAERGRLTIYKIGKRYYTTPGDVKDMVQQCRVDQKAPASISMRSAANMPSETERVSSALAAARETAQRLKSSSKSTLGKSTNLNRQTRQ